MTVSGIIMMCIVCITLWGGATASLIIMFRHSDKDLAGVIEEIEEAESSLPENEDDE